MLKDKLGLKIVHPKSIYWESFKMLYNDLEDSFRYVHPSSDHFKVYSFRYYELLLRTCTEFESICKDRVHDLELSNKKDADLSIKDYQLLNDQNGKLLSNYEVIFKLDDSHFTQPLKSWATTHSLSWYQDYNTVKHNRASKFSYANLENVLNSFGALFILIWISGMCPPASGLTYLKHDGAVIKVKCDDSWPVMLRNNL